MMKFSHITKAVLVAGAIASLAACDGSDNGSANNNPSVDTNTGLAPIVLSNLNPQAIESNGAYIQADPNAKAKVLITELSSESNSITFNMPKDITGTGKLVNLNKIYPIIVPRQTVESIYINNILIPLGTESTYAVLSSPTNKLKIVYNSTESKEFNIILKMNEESSSVLLNDVELSRNVKDGLLITTPAVIHSTTGVVTSIIGTLDNSGTTKLYPRFFFDDNIAAEAMPTVSIGSNSTINFESVPGFSGYAMANYTVTSKDGKTTIEYPHLLQTNADDHTEALDCKLEAPTLTLCEIDTDTHKITIFTPYGESAPVTGIFTMSYLGKSITVNGISHNENPFILESALTVTESVAQDVIVHSKADGVVTTGEDTTYQMKAEAAPTPPVLTK